MNYSELKEKIPEVDWCKCTGTNIKKSTNLYGLAEVTAAYVEQPNGDLKRVWPEPEEWRELPEAHNYFVRGWHFSNCLPSFLKSNGHGYNVRYQLLCSTIPSLEEFARMLKEAK